MKRLYSILSATILLGTILPKATAAVEVSVDFFHENLDAYGDWREVGDYGYCWQPRDVERDWRPYSDGHWLYTDAGWTWDSEEPYSWAVYHYGRWTRVAEVGWVWVPGTEWGPAWVSWRRSPEYVGWAPLPPEARFEASVGFGGRVDVDFDIGPAFYSFVQVRNFGAPRLRTVIVEPRENITIINRTTNITKVTYVNNVVYNGGPRYEDISRESAQPIRRLKLERRAEIGGDSRAQLRSKVEGDSFQAIAPTFDKKPATAPKKVAAKVEKAQVDHGWKDAGPPEEVAKVREKIKSEPATAAADAPPQPKPGKAGEAPDAPVAPTAPDGKPGKGKARDGDRPAVATDPGAPEPGKPTPETTPAPPEKVMPGQPPRKPGKHEPAKPGAGPDQLVPPAGEDAVSPGQPKKGPKKGNGDPGRPEVQPNEATPDRPAPERRPLPDNAEPPRKPAPPQGESPREKLRPGQGEARPRPEPPGAERKPERPDRPDRPERPNAPDRPERPNRPEAPEPRAKERPEARPQANRPPQPPEAPKGKGKGKEKDEKKPE